MAKKDQVNAAYKAIMEGADKKTATKDKPNPVGVALDAEELNRLGEIAEELGVSRHAVLQYAIRDLIRRYDAGDKPKTKTKQVVTLE